MSAAPAGTAQLRAARPPQAPAKGRYRLSSLINIPNRLVKPGELIEKDLEKLNSADGKRPQVYGDATGGHGGLLPTAGGAAGC